MMLVPAAASGGLAAWGGAAPLWAAACCLPAAAHDWERLQRAIDRIADAARRTN